MQTELQTLLGAGGVIGNELMHELPGYTARIRLVRRHPSPPGPGMEACAADLLDARQTADALRGSQVAYLVAGLPYRSSVWEAEWPVIMRNVIDACKTHGVRLVFLDNVYMYGQVDGPMTEQTPINPCSRKGAVRARIAQMLLEEIRAGRLEGLIARAADFYGPGACHTFVHPMVFEQLRDGEKAAWLGNDQVPHAMTYTPDAGRAMALLGNTPDAYGRLWHLPTHPDALTGREFIAQVAAAFRTAPRYRVLGPWMLKIAGRFSPTVRESQELLYQNTYPYRFDSSAFTQRFFPPTPYADGIRATARGMQASA